jgi:glycylpeptide N-tetradecanoyltransferase
VLGHAEHTALRACYMYLTAPVATPLRQLLHDALVLARAAGYDVFNALDIMENDAELLKGLRFGIGDGQLQYYLYNWRPPGGGMAPSDLGLILM